MSSSSSLDEGARQPAIVSLACAVAAAACGLIGTAPACAQPYPARPVRLVMPYAVGGSSDVGVRIVSQKLTTALGQQVIVENRPGAGGNIGAAYVAKAAPDGYTLLLVANAHAIGAALYSRLDYDLAKDFSPITLINSYPLILVVHPALPVRSVKELVALARARPGELFFSSSGNGSSPHMAGQLFSSAAAVKLVHVPHTGSSASITDVLSGATQLVFSPLITVAPQMKAGRMRALGVTSTRRAAAAPELPTLAEAGVPGAVVEVWNGVSAPAGTPREIITRLNAEFVKVIGMPDTRELFSNQGVEPVTDTPEEFAAHISAELAKWRKVVRESGARVD